VAVSDAVMGMAIKYLKSWLRKKANEDGVIDSCGVRAIAREHGISKTTAGKMVQTLRQEGFIISVNDLHRPQIVIRAHGVPRGGPPVPRAGTPVPRAGTPLKDSNSSNGYEFKESSSSSWKPAKNWRLEHSDDDDDHDRLFRQTLHEIYRLEGRHAGKLLDEARAYFQAHFIESHDGPDRLNLLAELLPAWQDRWSQPNQLNFKPRFIRFLSDVVEGGEFGHKPT
jgi:hypothetical protein